MTSILAKIHRDILSTFNTAESSNNEHINPNWTWNVEVKVKVN